MIFLILVRDQMLTLLVPLIIPHVTHYPGQQTCSSVPRPLLNLTGHEPRFYQVITQH